MIIRLEDPAGKAWEWAWGGMPTLAEARLIKAHTRMSVAQFLDGIVAGDPDALTALLMILYRRSGREIPFDEIDCDLSKLLFIDDEDDEDEPEGEPGGKAPSLDSGTTPTAV